MPAINISQQVLQGAIKGFVNRAAPLQAFNVVPLGSKVPFGEGDIVQVPYITGSASQPFVAATGYNYDNVGTNGTSVTLNIHLTNELKVTDDQITKLPEQALTYQVQIAASRLASDVISASIASVVSAANFPASSSYTSAQWTSSVAMAEMVGLSVNWNKRSLIAGPTLTTALWQNPQLVNAYALGSAMAVQEGETNGTKFFGFDIYQVGIPLPISDTGFACANQAITIVNGLFAPPDNVDTLRFEVLTDEVTGLQIGFREWYDLHYARTRRILEYLGGVAKVESTGLYHIK